jgi:hypothetical protein
LPGFRGLQIFLEVAIFGENVSERLFDDIVGASADESGILIDLAAVVSVKRIEAPIGRVWMTSSSGIAFSLGDELKQSRYG